MAAANMPSPSPSSASGSGIKRKISALATPRRTAVEMARANESKPKETLTQVHFATEHLKATGAELTFDDLIQYLSIQRAPEEELKKLRAVMQAGRHPKIEYKPKGAGGKGTFVYRPLIPVKNSEQLKAYLQSRTSALGVKVDDIKDGWPDCNPFLESMAGRGEVLLVRGGNKSKGQEQPKAVWQNDPTLCNRIDEGLKRQWESIQIPILEETLRDKLIAAGQVPTTAPRVPVVAANANAKKTRKVRKGARGATTNIGITLKDYSHLRK